MQEDWTRQELEDEMIRLRERSKSIAEWGALSFVMRLLAFHYPDRNRIINPDGT